MVFDQVRPAARRDQVVFSCVLTTVSVMFDQVRPQPAESTVAAVAPFGVPTLAESSLGVPSLAESSLGVPALAPFKIVSVSFALLVVQLPHRDAFVDSAARFC
jgi:hypothetical protein